MKRFLIFLGAFLIMQTIIGYNAKASDDFVWMKETHYNYYVEFSPTHNYFLSRGSITGSRKGVIIFNTEGETIKVIYESEGLEFRNTQGIWDAHFSRDGKFMVVIWEYEKDKLSHGMLEIFETENWTSVKKYAVPDGYYTRSGIKCLISPDNSIVTAITMDGFYFYDVVSGDLIKHVRDFGHNSMDYVSIYKSFYSADGQYIYFNASDNKLRYLNTQTYQIDYTRQDQSDFVQYGCIAVSKSRNLLVNDASKNELRIINTQTKETTLSIPISTAAIQGLEFTNDERYLGVSLGYLSKINIYDIQTGEIIKTYTDATFGGIDFSKDDKFIITTLGQYLILLSAKTTSVEEEKDFTDNILYPNPANNTVNIRFNLNISGFSKIAVYDNTGREVKRVFQGHLERGEQNIQGDIRGLKTGNYFIKVSAPGTDITYKLIINN